MCLAIPAQVVAVPDELPGNGVVVADGVRREVVIGLVHEEPVRPGDWVLVHLGFVMERLDPDDARALLDELGKGDAGEPT